MKIISFFTRPVVAITIVIVVGVVGATVYFSGDNESPRDLFTVERRDLTQTVTVTGRVKPQEEVSLAFDLSGRITALPVRIGNTTEEGAVLARVDDAELRASLAEAEAEVRNQSSQLEGLLRGTREEDINIKEAELAEARQLLDNYYRSVIPRLEDAYAQSDDAVRTKTISLFSGSRSTGFSLTFNSCYDTLENQVRLLRFEAEVELESWRTELNGLSLSSPTSAIDAALNNGLRRLTVMRMFLERMNEALTTECSLANSSLSSSREKVSAGRTAVTSAATSVDSLLQNIFSQKLSVLRIERELDLKKAGSTAEQISAQRAKLAQADAALEKIHAQLSKTTILAPFSGVVTAVDAEIGEIVSANSPLISLISEGAFEITTNIPEADIPKVGVGNTAMVTLDAYREGVRFEARVISIDPAATFIEGVPTYVTTLHFTEPDPRIRVGMTADIELVTLRKENVLAVPARLLRLRGNARMVFLMQNGALTEVEVTTGIRDAAGNVEILSGLREGDVIASPPEE